MSPGPDSRGPRPPIRSAAESILGEYPVGTVIVGGDAKVAAAGAAGDGLANAVAAAGDGKFAVIVARAADSLETGQVKIKMADGSSQDVAVVPAGGGFAALVPKQIPSLEKNLIKALADSRQRYRDLVEVSSDFAWEIGPGGTFEFVSPRGALDYAAADLIGRDPRDLIIDAPGGEAAAGGQGDAEIPFFCTKPVENAEIWVRRADGAATCLLTSSLPLLRRDGGWMGARGVCRDVTEERRRDRALARARDRQILLNELVTIIRDEIDPSEALATAARVAARSVGAAGCRIFRYSGGTEGHGAFDIAAVFGEENGGPDGEAVRPSIEKSDAPARISGPGFSGLAAAVRHRRNINGVICLWEKNQGGGPDTSGERDWNEDDLALIEAVAIQLGIAIEQLAQHERIIRLSRTDELTGVLNRRAFFEEEMPRRVQRLKISREIGALLYFDLDNFKEVNDRHGHQRGDEALLFLSDFLISHSRPGDIVGRFGGDEFGIWIDGIDEKTVIGRARRIIEDSTVLRKFSGDDDRPLGLSLGIALYDPESDESLSDLLARADAAMYEAKRGGKGRYVVAPPAGRFAAWRESRQT